MAMSILLINGKPHSGPKAVPCLIPTGQHYLLIHFALPYALYIYRQLCTIKEKFKIISAFPLN